jgi:tripartite-type tricarboxylate transporter receptor subunit TctC
MKKLLMAAAMALAAGVASAFPDRPITIIVPFAAGGPTDTVARSFAEALRTPLGGGATIVVENVGGAGGTVGANRAARATADGHTLLLAHIGLATAPTLFRNLPFRPLEAFEFVGMINEVPMTLVGRPTLPANNMTELTRWINDNRGRINLANAGVGSASHLCGLLFQQAMQVEMTTVPYRGTAPAMTDLIGGQVDLMCDQTTNTTPQIEGNKIKAFAVTTTRRLTTPALRNLPTLDESGLRGFNVTVWHGLYAPRGTPPAVVQRLNAALQTAVRDPEFVRRMEALGAVMITDERTTSAGHRRFVAAEIDRWAPVIRAAGQFAD